ncbi:MAG: GNAT family N-acetyltransferase [Bacteroidota bacterium]
MSAILESQRIKLRAIEPEDLELFYLWENNPDIWRVSNTLVPFSKFILRKYIENSHLDIFQTKQTRFMIVQIQTQKTIGTIDLFDFDSLNRRVGIGILIAENEFKNKGYAYESIDIIKKYCFSFLDLHQIYCNIFEYNIASINLFKKAGFKQTSCKKDWILLNNKWINELTFQFINI